MEKKNIVRKKADTENNNLFMRNVWMAALVVFAVLAFVFFSTAFISYRAPLDATAVVENIPEAEGLFNRRGRKKSDGYDPDNFYNFFDEQEKKDK